VGRALSIILAAGTAVLLSTSSIAVASSPPSVGSNNVTRACPDMLFLGVRGSGETANDAGGYGSTIQAVLRRMQEEHTRIAARAIDYAAVPVDIVSPSYGLRYYTSVRGGVRAVRNAVSSHVRGRCGLKSPIVMAGYSQGAHVVGNAFDRLTNAEKSRVVGVALVADPLFNGSASVNVGDFDPDRNGVIPEIVGSPAREVPQRWRDRVSSYCTASDPVCNWSLGAGLYCKDNMEACPHLHYVDRLLGDRTWSQAAGEFLLSAYWSASATARFGDARDRAAAGGYWDLRRTAIDPRHRDGASIGVYHPYLSQPGGWVDVWIDIRGTSPAPDFVWVTAWEGEYGFFRTRSWGFDSIRPLRCRYRASGTRGAQGTIFSFERACIGKPSAFRVAVRVQSNFIGGQPTLTDWGRDRRTYYPWVS
jgi:hypothetical protein